MFVWAVGGLIVITLIFIVVMFCWNHRMMNDRNDVLQKMELEKLERDLLRIKTNNQ